MTLTLTRAELVEITGFRRATMQADFIRKHYGIQAVVNAANECIVIRAHLERREAPTPAAARMRAVRKAA